MCSHPGKKNNSVPGCTVPWIYDCVKFERMTNLYKAFQCQAELYSGGSKAAQSLQPYRQSYFTSSFRFIGCTPFYPGLTHSGKDKSCALHFISPVPKEDGFRWLCWEEFFSVWMPHFIVGHGDRTCFLFSGDHKVSTAFMFSSLRAHFFQLRSAVLSWVGLRQQFNSR